MFSKELGWNKKWSKFCDCNSSVRYNLGISFITICKSDIIERERDRERERDTEIQRLRERQRDKARDTEVE